ncbi:MAG: hypothetical protein KAT68_02845 [Bacteroidales bacterium]|nr:hypothetical protein [Bacteroidales bacterium]
MKGLKNILIFVIFYLLCNSIYSQAIIPKTPNDEYYIETNYYLGFSLLVTANSSPVTYAIIKEMENGKKDVRFISKQTFIRLLKGEQYCKANPDKENLLKKYDIDQSSIDKLWKLRYAEFPFFGRDEKGWANKPGLPSDGQFNLLKQYGIYDVRTFCYGENAFKLLKDIQSINWVNLYKSL